MTAALIPAIAITVAVSAVLVALRLPGCAWTWGRCKRRARHFTDWSLHRPEVPHLHTVTDADYAADQPAEVLPADATDEQLKQAIFDALFFAMPEVVEDRRRAA